MAYYREILTCPDCGSRYGADFHRQINADRDVLYCHCCGGVLYSYREAKDWFITEVIEEAPDCEERKRAREET